MIHLLSLSRHGQTDRQTPITTTTTTTPMLFSQKNVGNRAFYLQWGSQSLCGMCSETFLYHQGSQSLKLQVLAVNEAVSWLGVQCHPKCVHVGKQEKHAVVSPANFFPPTSSSLWWGCWEPAGRNSFAFPSALFLFSTLNWKFCSIYYFIIFGQPAISNRLLWLVTWAGLFEGNANQGSHLDLIL